MQKRQILLITVLAAGVMTIANNVLGARLHTERHYQDITCPAPGLTEFPVRTSDGAIAGRVDCLTEHYAIEHDFADKWAEGIGQALFYSAMTGKKAGLVLIAESAADCKYVSKALETIEQHKLWLTVWVVGPAAECGLPLMNQRVL